MLSMLLINEAYSAIAVASCLGSVSQDAAV